MANDQTPAYRTKHRQVVQRDPNHSPKTEEPSMRHQLQFLRVVFVAIALFTLSIVAFGQEETAATITGRVTDSAGAVVVGAAVVVTNKETNAQRHLETNTEGNYVVTPLTPGTYTVVVEHQGFKRYLQTVTLNTKDRRPVDVVLETGSTTETVTITTDAPLIQEGPTGQTLIS